MTSGPHPRGGCGGHHSHEISASLGWTLCLPSPDGLITSQRWTEERHCWEPPCPPAIMEANRVLNQKTKTKNKTENQTNNKLKTRKKEFIDIYI
jgi:hypothetical protein